jgi:hypothetical protein
VIAPEESRWLGRLADTLSLDVPTRIRWEKAIRRPGSLAEVIQAVRDEIRAAWVGLSKRDQDAVGPLPDGV